MNSLSFKGNFIVDSQIQRSPILNPDKINYPKFVKLNKDFAKLTPSNNMTLRMIGITKDKARFCLQDKEKKVISRGTFAFDGSQMFTNVKSLVEIFNKLQARAIEATKHNTISKKEKEAIIKLFENYQKIGINQDELKTLIEELNEIKTTRR